MVVFGEKAVYFCLFMTVFGYAAMRPGTTEYLLDIVCQEHYGDGIHHSGKECDKGPINSKTADWSVKLTVAEMVPGVISACIFGAYSDHVGRRLLLILPALGQTVKTFGYFVSAQWALSLNWLYVGCFISGTMGGVTTYFLASFSYTADISNKKDRQLKVAICESALLLGGMVGPLFEGYIVTKHSIELLYLIISFMYLILCLAGFLIKESLPPEHRCNEKLSWRDLTPWATLSILVSNPVEEEVLRQMEEEATEDQFFVENERADYGSSHTYSIDSIGEEYHVLPSDRSATNESIQTNVDTDDTTTNNSVIDVHSSRARSYSTADELTQTKFRFNIAERSQLLWFAVAFGLQFSTLIGFYTLSVLYSKYQFHFGNDTVSYYLTLDYALKGFCIIGILKAHAYWFKDKISELDVAKVTYFFGIAAFLMMALVKSPFLYFLSTIPDGIGVLGAPILRAEMSKSVGASAQGRVFTTISVIESLVGLGIPLIFGEIYSHTSFFPQMSYLILSSFFLIAIICLNKAKSCKQKVLDGGDLTYEKSF